MIIGFDFDDTLVKRWTATPLPGVRERLAELPDGTRTFIATNQAGPVWRQMTGDAKYPTCEDVAQRIADGLRALEWWPDLLLIAVHPGQAGDAWAQAARETALGLRRAIVKANFGPAYWAVYDQDHYRKPDRGMLDQARIFGLPFREQIIYIGDMDTDRQAADAAGCRYLDAAVWREKGIA